MRRARPQDASGGARPEDAERSRQRKERAEAADQKVLASVKAGVSALLDRKAEKLLVLTLKDVTSMADYFVLASATNERQAQALADAVEETLKKSFGSRPISVEGYLGATWILLDYGDIVFHVFREEARKFYGLERLWGDAPDATASFVS